MRFGAQSSTCGRRILRVRYHRVVRTRRMRRQQVELCAPKRMSHVHVAWVLWCYGEGTAAIRPHSLRLGSWLPSAVCMETRGCRCTLVLSGPVIMLLLYAG